MKHHSKQIPRKTNKQTNKKSDCTKKHVWQLQEISIIH